MIQRADGLACRRNDTPDLLELFAEEVQADGIHQVAWENVHRSASHRKRTRSIQLPRIRIALRLELAQQVVELLNTGQAHVGKLESDLQGKGIHSQAVSRRHHAQKRASACNDDARTIGPQRVRRLHALSHDSQVRGLGRKGEISAFGEAQHALLPHIGGDVARERQSRFLARHHDKRRLGLMRKTRCHHERSRRSSDGQGGVFASVELAPEVIQTARFLQSKSQGVDKH